VFDPATHRDLEFYAQRAKMQFWFIVKGTVMPKLIKLYITQAVIGFAISAVFVGALLYFNVANLWHLVTHSDVGILAVVILWVSNGIVFAGVQFAITIMGMAGKNDDDDTGGKRDDLPVLAAPMPIPVKVSERR